MSTMRMDSYATLAGRLAGVPARAAPGARIARVLDTMLVWQERARQRQQLREFADHLLQDLGLTRADVEAEVSKPFWRP